MQACQLFQQPESNLRKQEHGTFSLAQQLSFHFANSSEYHQNLLHRHTSINHFHFLGYKRTLNGQKKISNKKHDLYGQSPA